jgi:hypothetical protein
VGAGTTAPIEIGFLVLENEDAFNATFGVGGGSGDPKTQVSIVVAEINKNGGIGGRKVVPVFGVFNLSDTATFATAMQAICTQWTQDHHVSAAINSNLYNTMDELDACLKKAGVPLISMREYPDNTALYPNVFNSAFLNLERMSPVLVDGLKAQGFFGSRPKIGLLANDIPWFRQAVDRWLKPARKRHGYQIDQVYWAAQGGNFATQIQSAELQFQGNGVTHVMFLWPSGGAFFFLQYAESQRYYPKYGLSSLDAPGGLLQGVDPNSQLANAYGVGWNPVVDVDLAHDPGGNPSTIACQKILAKGGAPADTRANQRNSYGYCDGLWILQRAAALKGTSPAQLLAGIPLVGSFRSPYSFGNRFAVGLHDAPSAVRNLRFSTTCNCFAYTGPVRPVA